MNSWWFSLFYLFSCDFFVSSSIFKPELVIAHRVCLLWAEPYALIIENTGSRDVKFCVIALKHSLCRVLKCLKLTHEESVGGNNTRNKHSLQFTVPWRQNTSTTTVQMHRVHGGTKMSLVFVLTCNNSNYPTAYTIINVRTLNGLYSDHLGPSICFISGSPVEVLKSCWCGWIMVKCLVKHCTMELVSVERKFSHFFIGSF